jgi:hypothetical protein
MKKIFTLFFVLLMNLNSVKAAGAIYEMYVSVSVNGAAVSNYNNTNFDATSLATNLNPNTNTLIMKSEGLNAWANNGSAHNSAQMHYRVYKSDATPPSFTAFNLPANGTSGNNSFWNINTDINLLAGVSAIGTYYVELYFQTATNSVDIASSTYFSNSSNNYKATFTTSTVLATDFTSFGILNNKGQNNLSWLTASEKNNANFNIQRSPNSQTWQTLGSVKATNNPSGAKYNFTDEAPLSTLNYYRLQMVDNDGKMTYSKVVAVSNDGNKKSLAVYPNPVKSELTVITDGNTEGVSIFDMTGKMVRQFNDNRSKVDVADLPNGVYLMRLLDKNGLVGTPVRFVKQ